MMQNTKIVVIHYSESYMMIIYDDNFCRYFGASDAP